VTIRHLLLFVALLLLGGCTQPEPECITCQSEPLAPPPLEIIDRPIVFDASRIEMTKSYIQTHYHKRVSTIEMTPRVVVLHWTAMMDFEASFARLYPSKLLTDRTDIANASALNVSAHFMVARDGTIYRLMPENWVARHVIGLNYSAIGIENIGGQDNQSQDLTPAQVASNIALVKYLKAKYPTIEYLIGHYEYRAMESTPLWLEQDKGYRTIKRDPGEQFMRAVRHAVRPLKLKKPPKPPHE